MIAKFDPFDTFFFRDGKPFSLGDESWADGIFPPAPSVLYGALRTLFLARNGGFDKSQHDLDKATEKLTIKGIFIENGGRVHLPLPFDVVQDKEREKKTTILQLKTAHGESLFNNMTSCLLSPSDSDFIAERFENGAIIKSSVFEDYLSGKPPTKPVELGEYLCSESKVGIGRNNSKRTVSEGELFRVDMKRLLPDTQIVVDFEFEGWTPPATQTGRLGGESKAVTCTFEDTSMVKPGFPNLTINEEGKIRFKLCLATPAIFKNGWYPGWLKEDQTGNYQGIELKLLAAATGKSISVGGWDMKAGKPKTMYRAVPAGAVYCFEAATTDLKKIEKAFHYQSISELETAQEGFGVTFVGKLSD